MYDAVPSLLSTTVRLSAFPDGSVDRFRHVHGPAEDDGRLTVTEFRDRLPGNLAREFEIRTVAVEAGGQAVNAAQQAHALGDDVRLDGFLDDPRLEFPFETHSFGPPADVEIHQFPDGDVIYVEESPAFTDWQHGAFESVPAADAYVCGNWTSMPGQTDALRALAEAVSGVVVIDPGNVAARPAAARRGFADAMGTLDGPADVVLSVNGRELSAMADALGVPGDPEPVRAAAAVSVVVVHRRESATVAARDGPAALEVPNLAIDAPARHTGGGDRFSAGFAHGLAVGGDPGAAAALGNTCASYYVETGETGTSEDLTAFLSDRGLT